MNADTSFDPVSLLEVFHSLPAVTGYCIALSGGADSVALLVAMTELRTRLGKPIRAVHIHHGMQREADGWTLFCEALCRERDLPLQVHRVQVVQSRGESLEAAARRERYASLAASLQGDEVLLTAHHQDDQVETMLLHLLKGAGTDGLAAMPVKRPFSRGLLLRPLLRYRRSQLVGFLASRDISWIDDPSNRDTRFDRNYLRQVVIPDITSRWPGSVACLFRAAELQSSQRLLAEELAGIDLAAGYEQGTGTLKVAALLPLTPERRLNLLRFWLHSHQPEVRLSRRQLQVLERQIVHGGGKGGFLFQAGGHNIRQFQGRLYKDRLEAAVGFDGIKWRLDGALVIESLNFTLESSQLLRAIPRLRAVDTVEVHPRRGGEVIVLPGRGRRSVKRLLQEWDVPLWLRSRIPLIWSEGRLICIPGYWVDSCQ